MRIESDSENEWESENEEEKETGHPLKIKSFCFNNVTLIMRSFWVGFFLFYFILLFHFGPMNENEFYISYPKKGKKNLNENWLYRCLNLQYITLYIFPSISSISRILEKADEMNIYVFAINGINFQGPEIEIACNFWNNKKTQHVLSSWRLYYLDSYAN